MLLDELGSIPATLNTSKKKDSGNITTRNNVMLETYQTEQATYCLL